MYASECVDAPPQQTELSPGQPSPGSGNSNALAASRSSHESRRPCGAGPRPSSTPISIAVGSPVRAEPPQLSRPIWFSPGGGSPLKVAREHVISCISRLDLSARSPPKPSAYSALGKREPDSPPRDVAASSSTMPVNQGSPEARVPGLSQVHKMIAMSPAGRSKMRTPNRQGHSCIAVDDDDDGLPDLVVHQERYSSPVVRPSADGPPPSSSVVDLGQVHAHIGAAASSRRAPAADLAVCEPRATSPLQEAIVVGRSGAEHVAERRSHSAAGVGDMDDIGSDFRRGQLLDRSPGSATQSPARQLENADPTTDGTPSPEGDAGCSSSSSPASQQSDDIEAGVVSRRLGEELAVKDCDDDQGDQSVVCANRFVLAYSKHVPGRWPCLCTWCGLLVVLATTALGMIFMPPSVETDFGAFMKTDVNTSIMRDAFLYSLSDRHEKGRRLAGNVYINFDVAIVYELPANSGLTSFFDASALSHILRLESFLRASPMWQAMCKGGPVNEQPLCQTGLSFANYALPSLTRSDGDVVPSTLTFDGEGVDMVSLDTTLRMLQQHNLMQFLMPSGFSAQDDSVDYLRTVFRFKRTWCCSSHSLSNVRKRADAYRAEWSGFIKDELIPTLQAAARGKVDGEPWPLHVYFDGEGIATSEVIGTLQGDLKLACGSVTFVFAYLIFHTRSVVLGFFGLMLITMSVPLSYVAFAVMTGSRELHIASFLSVFLIVGLGSDVIFVYNDFWNESAQMSKSIPGRMGWTLHHAGKASLATSVTTAVSFFANLASVLKPLRDFGFFMGLCVMLVWILLSTLFLPLCLINERYCSRIRLRCPCVQHSALTRRLGGNEDRVRAWTKHLYRWRRTCIFSTVVACSVALFCSVGSVKVETGLPSIFPKKHNQNQGKEVLAMFVPVTEILHPFFQPPEPAAAVCREHTFGAYDDNECSLFWCEAKHSDQLAGSPSTGSCQCFRKAKPPCASNYRSAAVTVEQRWVDPNLTEAAFAAAARLYLVNSTAGASVTDQSQLAPIVLEEWETGVAHVLPMLRLQAEIPKPSDGSCGWQEMCFCGVSQCLLPSEWRPARTFELPMSVDEEQGLTTLAGRKLKVYQQWIVPSNQRALLEVVFGIDVIAGPQLLRQINWEESWVFQPQHDMRYHWAQRNLYSLCTNVPEKLKVTDSRCWIEDFRDYVVGQGERFPIAFPELFDSMLAKFLRFGITGTQSSKNFIWLRDGTAKASYFAFNIDLSKYAESEEAITHMLNWNDYLYSWNLGAHTSARGAWHTSSLWVRAQAQKELISSTVMTLVIVLVLAFFGMMVFTGDVTLAFLVVMATISVISGLVFFIVFIMGWAIGPIEVIALIVFIGYAVTYSLHIAHRYGASEASREGGDAWLPESLAPATRARHERVVFALRSIGGAALGSAATTVGCSVFLLFCTLTIFKKLGGVVLAVTLMSIAMALIPLPAALLAIGPRNPGWRGPPWRDVLRSILAGMASQMAEGPAKKYAVDHYTGNEPAAAPESPHPTSATRSPRAGSTEGDQNDEPVDADFDISTIFWWARDVVGSVKDCAMDFGRAPAAGGA